MKQHKIAITPNQLRIFQELKGKAFEKIQAAQNELNRELFIAAASILAAGTKIGQEERITVTGWTDNPPRLLITTGEPDPLAEKKEAHPAPPPGLPHDPKLSKSRRRK